MISQLQKMRMDKAYRFISNYQEKEGISPTVREVQNHLGLSSSSMAYVVVRNLQMAGKITMNKKSPRSMKIRKP